MKNGRAFPIMIIATAVVVTVSLLPLNSMSSGLLKDFSLWSDLFPQEQTAQAGGDTYVDPDLAIIKEEFANADDPTPGDTPVEQDSEEATDSESRAVTPIEANESPLPDKPVRKEGGAVEIEDFSGHRLPNFRAAMASRDSRPVRIAVIGDSYIEGDIFTQNVREKLQEQYGGNGVGYLPVHSDLTGFRQSIIQTCSGWEKHDFRHKGSQKPIFGIYHSAEENAKTTVKGSKKMHRSATWNNSKFLFIAPTATTITLSGDNGDQQFTVEASDEVQCVEYDGFTKQLSLSTPSTDLVSLGLYLNDNSGIAVDNMSIRGYSGIKHSELSPRLAQQMRRFIDYDLIIVEYGINALSSDETNYAYYTRAMEKAIATIREAYPQSDILIMGIGDRGEKTGADVHSMKSVPYMVDQQRKMAHKLQIPFWDTREAMGGHDAVVQWADSRDVNKDYIHLSFKGGDRLASLFVTSLNELIND
ncbi:MAG: GDSL-type esterase/lipase family protein [Muribaculaceae bacterium]|nr:GDSL-type esterase/lipase family protein [Muribaculaceae bacterium]